MSVRVACSQGPYSLDSPTPSMTPHASVTPSSGGSGGGGSGGGGGGGGGGQTSLSLTPWKPSKAGPDRNSFQFLLDVSRHKCGSRG